MRRPSQNDGIDRPLRLIAQDVVEAGVLLDGAEHAERNTDQRREGEREAGEPGGDRDARQDLGERRLLGDVGIAEVAVREADDPVDVLGHERLVEAELALEPGLVGRIDQAGGREQDVGDVARHQAQHHEDEDRDAEQGQQHQQEAPDQVAGQRSSPIPQLGVIARSPKGDEAISAAHSCASETRLLRFARNDTHAQAERDCFASVAMTHRARSRLCVTYPARRPRSGSRCRSC
jgi:hypothetical protein